MLQLCPLSSWLSLEWHLYPDIPRVFDGLDRVNFDKSYSCSFKVKMLQRHSSSSRLSLEWNGTYTPIFLMFSLESFSSTLIKFIQAILKMLSGIPPHPGYLNWYEMVHLPRFSSFFDGIVLEKWLERFWRCPPNCRISQPMILPNCSISPISISGLGSTFRQK